MKAIVIGCPGSGKSYFSNELSKLKNVPLYHLDNLYWHSDRSHVDREELKRRQEEIFRKDNWLIDGNYLSTMERRLEECDTVYFLDLPVEICLDGAIKRCGSKRDDLPWVETDGIDEEFKNYILAFPKEQIPEIYKLLAKYKDKELHIFKTREEVNAYLNYLQ